MFTAIKFWIIKTVLAQDVNLLVPLPDLREGGSGTAIKIGSINDYLKILFPLFLWVSSLLAVTYFVWGGLQYMMSELPYMKGEGKSKMENAVLGMAIILISWLILNEINPQINAWKLNFG